MPTGRWLHTVPNLLAIDDIGNRPNIDARNWPNNRGTSSSCYWSSTHSWSGDRCKSSPASLKTCFNAALIHKIRQLICPHRSNRIHITWIDTSRNPTPSSSRMTSNNIWVGHIQCFSVNVKVRCCYYVISPINMSDYEPGM